MHFDLNLNKLEVFVYHSDGDFNLKVGYMTPYQREKNGLNRSIYLEIPAWSSITGSCIYRWHRFHFDSYSLKLLKEYNNLITAK